MKIKKIMSAAIAALIASSTFSVVSYAQNAVETFDGLTSENAASYFNFYQRSLTEKSINNEGILKEYKVSAENRSETETDKAFTFTVPAGKTFTNNRPVLMTKDKSVSIEKGEWAHISFDCKNSSASAGGIQVMTILDWNIDGSKVSDFNMNSGDGFAQGLLTAGTDSERVYTFGEATYVDNNGKTTVTPTNSLIVKNDNACDWHKYDFYIGGPEGDSCLVFVDGVYKRTFKCAVYADANIPKRDKPKYVCGVNNLVFTFGPHNSSNIYRPHWTNELKNLTSDCYYSVDNILIEKSSAPYLPKISFDGSDVSASLNVNSGIEFTENTTLIIASYKDGVLTDVKCQAKGNEKRTVKAELKNVASGSVVKAMVLKSMTDISPLMESVTANIN